MQWSCSVFNIILLKWPSGLNTVKYMSGQWLHKCTELVLSSLGQQTFTEAEWLILLLLCYLKHRPISHLQIASRVVADFDSCHDKTQNTPAAACVSTFLGNGTSLRSWHVGVWFHTILRFICKQSCGTGLRGQYEHRITGTFSALNFKTTQRFYCSIVFFHYKVSYF